MKSKPDYSQRRPKLTYREKQDYVQTKGYRCPYCGAYELETVSDYRKTYDGVFVDIGCLVCRATWTERYRLFSMITHGSKL